MNRAIYPILSGALAQEREMQVFANNMANVNTAGFKQDDQAFKSVMAHVQAAVPILTHSAGFGEQIGVRPFGPDERVFVAPHAVRTSFEAGRIRITGNPLDAAIQGSGFFEVKTPQGIRYTRSGMFSLDSQRRLVTNLGYPVMGSKGRNQDSARHGPGERARGDRCRWTTGRHTQVDGFPRGSHAPEA